MKQESQSKSNQHLSNVLSKSHPGTTRMDKVSNSKQMMQTSQNFQPKKSSEAILPSVSYPNQVNTKSFSQHPYWEKEKLYDLCLKLQTSVNLLNHQVRVEKIKNNKKEDEISKQKALLKEIDENVKQSSNKDKDKYLNPVYAKVRESTLVSNLRQENKTLQDKLKEKEDELSELKKKAKMTKIKEIEIEVDVYEKEMIKMKQKLNNALESVEMNNKKDKLIKDYQEQLRRKNQKASNLEYDNEKIILSTEAMVKELNHEIENRNRTISRLEQEISKLKLKEYYHDKIQDKESDENEEETKKMLSVKTYQLFIAMKKQGLSIESIQSQVLDRINPNDKSEDMKIAFANYLIEMLNLIDLNDKASLLDYVTFAWQNEKELSKVSKKIVDLLKELFDEDNKKKENDLMELEKLVIEKEKKLKYELYKIDSSRKGVITFNAMKEVIQKAGIQKKEKDALILSIKPNSFNSMKYNCLLELAMIVGKKEYCKAKEADIINKTKENDNDEEEQKRKEKERGKKEMTNTLIINKNETNENKVQESKQIKTDKENDNKIDDSKSDSSEDNKKEDFPSFYQIIHNIKLNEFSASEYFRSIVQLFDNKNKDLGQIEGIKQSDFLSFLKNKDIHILPDECKRLFKAFKCKKINDKEVLDAQKLENELAKYMNSNDHDNNIQKESQETEDKKNLKEDKNNQKDKDNE